MPCKFPGCKRPTPTDWCLLHGKHYGPQTATSKAPQSLTIPELIEKAQKVVNAFIRDRDRVKGCITCATGQVTDAGHFIPIGENSAIRFEEDNIAGQCAKCNRMEAGKRKEFRSALIKRIGLQRVEELETAPKFNKWSRTQLENILSHYKK